MTTDFNKAHKGWERLCKITHRLLQEKFELYLRDVKTDAALEVGCGNGVDSVWIAKHFKYLEIVEIDKEIIGETRLSLIRADLGGKPMPAVAIKHTAIETASLSMAFDAIFLLHVLEHLDDPVEVLIKLRRALRKGGRIFISVPNAWSMHRLLGQHMRLHDCHVLNEQDKLLGHKRVYDPDSLHKDLRAAGLFADARFGSYVKPLPVREMDDWPIERIEGLAKLAEDANFYDHAAEICCVAVELSEE